MEAQLVLAEPVLKGVHESIDGQIERACNLEAEHALALYKTGKATLQDADEVRKEADRQWCSIIVERTKCFRLTRPTSKDSDSQISCHSRQISPARLIVNFRITFCFHSV